MSVTNTGWMPLWVRMKGVKCVVVGGGVVALRKISVLLEAGACVKVVTKRACSEVEKLAHAGLIELRIKEVAKEDLKGGRLVVVATDSGEVNRSVSAWAEELGVLCNVVDKPKLCTAVFPAIIRRGKLEVAVSTGGSSPAMAALIRDRIAELLPPGYELLLELLGEIRDRVKKMGLADEKRLELFRSLVDEQVLESCNKEKEAELRAILEKRVQIALQEDHHSKNDAFQGLCDSGFKRGERLS